MGNTEALDFASLPPIFIITAGLPAEDLHQAEDAVYEHAGQLSYQPKEARIFLGRVSQKRRAAFELRSRGVWTEESTIAREPVRKRRRLNHIEETRSISGSETESEYEDGSSSLTFSPGSLSSLEDHVIVLKLDWLHKSINAGHFLPFQPYQVYCGRIVDKPEVESIVTTSQTQTITLIKATPDTPGAHIQSSSHTWNEHGSSITSILDSNLPTMKFSPRRFRDQHSARGTTSSTTLTALHVPSHPRLHRTTTSEHDFVAEKLPPQPSWLTARPPLPTFSCLRSTYANPPNTPFLKHLYKIKEARILTLDEIGVRAYSTAIASLSAYPHPYQAAGVITLLGRAFSRDQPQKIYIQDRMRLTIDDIVQAYRKEEGCFYLCGPTWPVPDVTNVLEEAIDREWKQSGVKVKKGETAKEIMKLKDEGRYVLEVY